MIEATPTFTLPNQIQVCVAKKVLAKGDLDLILTEYYEERLECRLKNRKTHMNEDNSTQPTVLSTPNLPIPSNWILTTKPSPSSHLFLFLHLFFLLCPYLLF